MRCDKARGKGSLQLLLNTTFSRVSMASQVKFNSVLVISCHNHRAKYPLSEANVEGGVFQSGVKSGHSVSGVKRWTWGGVLVLHGVGSTMQDWLLELPYRSVLGRMLLSCLQDPVALRGHL